MIGIDLVAYNLAANSRWEEERFKEKVLVPSEMKQLQYTSNTFLQFWEFWSAKEATFKAESHDYPDCIFHPKNYTCLPNNKVISSVSRRVFHYQTDHKPTYLTTLVSSNECEFTARSFEVHNIVKPSQISAAVRREVRNELRKNWSQGQDLEMPLNYGKLDSAFGSALYLSMSHHGAYGAFAISQLKELHHV